MNTTARRVVAIVLALTAGVASAQDGGQPFPDIPVSFSGYAEAHYQYNFNAPSNGVTNYRVVDNRHNTFTVPNVSIGAKVDAANIVARVALQVGHMPSTYYGGEPSLPGAAGANATGPELWKYVQEAYAGYRFDLGSGLLIRAGIFLSPIGPESVPAKDNWNWSRSNLFFGLPFYHTGVEASYRLTPDWTITLGGYNGWNSVVDNNDQKSLALYAVYERTGVRASFLYFTGVERSKGGVEGQPWRHLFDANVTWHATPWFSVLTHANGGFESNRLGVSAWAAGALYGRLKLHEIAFVAVRCDFFYETAARRDGTTASPIFWPAPWVSSGTATFELRPVDQISFRLEYRHDQSGAPMYFGGQVEGDGSTAAPFVPSRLSQDTLTLGAVAWF